MADIINFYEELGIGRDDTVAQIHDKLKELKLRLGAKLGRGRSSSQHWERQLELASKAEEVFADEDSRDRYDIELNRAAVSEAPVNWTTRAWNYYFIGDNGAAMVAARKAKEQSPGEAMPFVVSAWVQLREGEERLAKQDADEAFVLDELATDSVDVQEVRGTVYLCLRQYERALVSFDRALAKAADGEMPDLYWRRGLTYQEMGRHEKAYESGIAGICRPVAMTATTRKNLELVISDAIHGMDNRKLPTESIARYTYHRNEISNASMDDGSRSRLIENIDRNLARLHEVATRHQEVAQMRDELVRTQKQGEGEPPTQPRESMPTSTIGLGTIGCLGPFMLIGGVLLLSISPGFGIILLILLALMVAYTFRQRARLSEWLQVQQEYEASLAIYEANREDWLSKRQAIQRTLGAREFALDRLPNDPIRLPRSQDR